MLKKLGFKKDDFKIYLSFIKISYGSIIGPLIFIIAQPFIKAVYDPTVFGIYELYTKTTAILVVLFSLRYDVCIINEKTDYDSISILTIATFLGFCLMVFTLLLVSIFDEIILRYFAIPESFGNIIFIIPISAYLMVLFKLNHQILIRLDKFNQLSLSRIFRRFTEVLSQFHLSSLFSKFGIFFGEFLGNFFGLLYIFLNIRKKVFCNIARSIKHYKKKIYLNRETQLFLLPFDLLNVITESFFVIIFIKNFGFLYAGYLELSLKILLIPVAILGASTGSLILQSVSNSVQNNNHFTRKIILLTSLSSIAGLLFASLLLLYGEVFIKMFFGDKWIQSFYYCKILIFPVVIQLIISPLGQILIALKKYRIDALVKAIKFILLGSLFFFETQDIYQYLKMYSSLIIITYIIYSYFIVKETISYRLGNS